MGLNKTSFTLPEHQYVQADNGDIIGIADKRGNVTYFPASISQNGITASTSSDQTGLKLLYRSYRVTTVGTAGDSLVLPAAIAGQSMSIKNAAAANSMDVFPAVGEFINALSVNVAFAMPANTSAIFRCFVNGTWETNI